MKEIEILKEQVYNHGLNTLLKRMEAVLSEYQLQKLVKPVVISAEITDMEEVIKTIKSIYTCFDIKDIRLSVIDQSVFFKVYGSCYIPEKYRAYRLFRDSWSAEKTDECNYLRTIKEEYAEDMTLPITAFTKGIKVEIV